MMIKIFGEKVKLIEILPFGAIIKLDMQSNASSIRVLLISSFGVIMQLILYMPFMFFYNNGLINDLTYNIFLTYNKFIILFNIMPMLGSILEMVMPYKLNLKVINLVSIVVIIMFVIKSDINLSLIIITSFLAMETFKLIKNHSYIFNNFLLERYLYNIKHKRVKRVRSINQIYKNYYNFINNVRERDVLSSKFKPFN